MGWVCRLARWWLQRPKKTHNLPVVEDRIDRGIFYLHIMALHAKREQFGFGQGVNTVVFSSISFVFLLLLL